MTFALLVGASFFEVHFGVIFGRIGFDFGRTDPQSTRHGAVETHVGPFSNSWKKGKNMSTICSQNSSKIARNHEKVVSGNAHVFVLVFWLTFSQIFAPFWLHFGSILGTLDYPKNRRSLTGAPGSSTRALWLHFGSILEHFGSILAPFWLHFCSILAQF